MSNPCIKPIEAGSSPYTKTDSPFAKGTSPYGELCIDIIAYLFQDSQSYRFQDNEQFIFNL